MVKQNTQAHLQVRSMGCLPFERETPGPQNWFVT